MKYMDIYRRIQNPLQDENTISKILEAYAEKGSFYTNLINRNSKNKEKYYCVSSYDELYAFLFNTWKKEMLSIPRESYENAISKGLYDRDVYKLLELLRKTPDVATNKEASQILNKEYSDKELATAMEKYRWDSIGLFSGWTHISSRHVHAKKIVIPNIEHRLYINASLMALHELSTVFLKKCIDRNLPYYFKISESGRRDDNIVIYSDTENLPAYIKVLSEIEKEHPDIISRCDQPPILTGKIGSWCGYGSEPLSIHSSFNHIRSQSIEKAIDLEMQEWYKNNKNSTVQFNGQTMSLYEYLSKKVVERQFENSKRTLDRNPNSTSATYSYKEMSDPNVKPAIERFLSTELVNFMELYLNGKLRGETITFSMYQKERRIYGIDIVEELKAFVPIIAHNDPDFRKKIKKRIEIESANNGIDINNYCFDIETVELLRKADQANSAQSSSSPTIKESQDNKEYQYQPMTDEEILAAQKRLAGTEPAKVKKKK